MQIGRLGNILLFLARYPKAIADRYKVFKAIKIESRIEYTPNGFKIAVQEAIQKNNPIALAGLMGIASVRIAGGISIEDIGDFFELARSFIRQNKIRRNKLQILPMELPSMVLL